MALRDTLPAGTVVGEFEIRRVLGQGGFGIVYEAYEPMLDRRVALKEYFLQGFSRREGLDVLPAEADSVEMFNSGMSRFIREARLLSMLNERTRADGSLVAVYRVFQAQRTAFMAMKLYEGQTLRQEVLAKPEIVTEPWLVSLLLRMLDALHALHSLEGENLVHRDVSPDNIILQPDGRPVLLDFGATRKASDAQTSLIYKPGYSPIEQYTDAIKQGPWTDIYALSGVAYFAIARQSPVPAVDRYAGAAFQTAAERGAGRFSPELLALVDKGMSVLPEHRFQSAEAMREALTQLPAAHHAPGVTRQAPMSRTQAVATPTATAVSSPATTPLTPTAQGVADDDDVTRVNPTPTRIPDAGAPTVTWSPTAVPEAEREETRATVIPLPPKPDPGRRKGLLIGAGVAAAVAIGGAIVYLQRDGGAPGPQGGTAGLGGGAASQALAASQSGAASQVAQAASPAAASAPPEEASKPVTADTVPGLACTAAQADWACVLDGLARLSTRGQGVVLRVSPAEARLGNAITLEVVPAADGVLQMLAVDDTPDGRLVSIFPNSHDSSNRVKAGQALKLPRRPQWDIVAQPPKGRSWMIAVLSPEPLKLPPSLKQGLALKDAVRAFAEGQPLRLLGVSDCTSGGAGCPKTLSIQPADFIIR
ncbi:protein kinase domain-containing protein [Aquabacterium sp.]|uniref:serine/threonine-protein kinase n=1 Tax=Aquabacterium sp. TaxID=1872578 RepID=UPI003783BEA7